MAQNDATADDSVHPLVENGDPPGDWMHHMVGSGVGIVYTLPDGQGFEGESVPEGKRLVVALDPDDDDDVILSNRDVSIWYMVYDHTQILSRHGNTRKHVADAPDLETACEKLEAWMRDPEPGEVIVDDS